MPGPMSSFLEGSRRFGGVVGTLSTPLEYVVVSPANEDSSCGDALAKKKAIGNSGQRADKGGDLRC